MPPANPPDPWPRPPGTPEPDAPAPRPSWSRGARQRAWRERRRRLVGSLVGSAAIHLAVLTYFGMQLTNAYVLPEPPPLPDLPPVEAYLVPPLPPPPPPPPPKVAPTLEPRRIEPQPTPRVEPQPQPEAQPTPPRPAPPTPSPPNPTPNLLTNRPVTVAPNPAPARAVAPARQVPSPVLSNSVAAPTLTMPEPAPAPAPPAPEKKKEDEQQPTRTAPTAAAPRLVAPSAPASTDVAPLQMAPVPRPPPPAAGGGGGAAGGPPRGPAGANGDFSVKPMGLAPGSLRDALRGSTVGCDNRNAVALNKTERTTCDERVGVRGENAKPLAVGTELSKDKRRDMETQADLANRMREYKASGMPVGTGATMQDNLGQASPLTKR